jgi:ribosome maturation factor RimP
MLKDIIRNSLEGTKYYLYDVIDQTQTSSKTLTILIDHKDGITLDDCSEVSNLISEPLDQFEGLQDEYMLEIASAGAEHELRNEEELDMALGKKVFVRTFDQQITGMLEGFKDQLLKIRVEKKRLVEIQWMDIIECRLSL